MKAKFTLQEMYVIYALMEGAKMMSHKIALKKLVNDFLEDEDFGRSIEIKDITEKNLLKAKEAHKEDLEKFGKKMLPYRKNKPEDIPLELKLEEGELSRTILATASKKNKKLFTEFEKLMASKGNHEFDLGDLTKKAILAIAMDEDVKVADLGMSQDAIDSLADICVKLGIE